MKKGIYEGHSPEGGAMTQFILASFRLHGQLLEAGGRLTHSVGLTSARWQVLGALAHSAEPQPVGWVAREMGLTRQSVQRVVDDLEAAGLLMFQANPRHKRAALLVMTREGRRAFETITRLQVPWVNGLAEGTRIREIQTALRVVQRLSARLQSALGE